jgi:transcriptional regulator with XRE-family HTH domain
LEGGIGSRLKLWRQALGLTQAALAERIGVHIGVLKKYEQGLNVPGGEALAAIARTGVNMTWLLTGEGEMLPRKLHPDLQVIEGEGRSAPPDKDVARLLRQIEAILNADPDPERRLMRAQELFARAQELARLGELEQAVAELRSALDKARSRPV